MASSGTGAPLEDLFTSLWAALDGRALSSLHRAVTSAAFLSAVLECTVFMTRRIVLDGMKPREEGVTGALFSLVPDKNADFGEEARNLVRNQFGKVWEKIKSRRLKIEERAAARFVAQNLDALEKLDSGFSSNTIAQQGEGTVLRNTAWDVLQTGLKDATKSSPGLVATFLKVLFDHHKEGTYARTEVGELVHEVLTESGRRVDELLKAGNIEGVTEDVRFIECMLDQFREGLFDSQVFAQVRLTPGR